MVTNLAQFIAEGGVAAYACAALALLLWPAALAGLVAAVAAPRRASLIGAVLLASGALLLALSGAGYLQGTTAIDAALAYVDPSDAVAIRHQGQSELHAIWVVGLAAALLPLSTGAASLGLAGPRATPWGAADFVPAALLFVGAAAVVVAFAEHNLLRHQIEGAAAMVAPEDRPALLRAADEELERPWAGGIGGVVVLAAGVGAAFSRRSRARPE